MKQDAKVIILCMDLYFKGISLRQIRDHIKQFYGVSVWYIDETVVNVRGSKMAKGNYDWLWNLMDNETRFILSSQIHKNRFTADARQVLQEGKKNAKRIPAIVVSDSHGSYTNAVRKEIYRNADPQPQHVRVSPIKEGMENMPIER
jgi:transposase-like protein